MDMFKKMYDNGDIYLGSYTGNYCVSCETFFTKSQLAEGDTCPDCGKDVTDAKFCSNCGAQADGNFCANCGKKLS